MKRPYHESSMRNWEQPDEGGAMVKIDCRVPESLRDELEAACEERGHPTRSAGIREALRDWVDASPADDLEDGRNGGGLDGG